jgi:hypothetical protein
MADLVLDIQPQFCKSLVIAVRLENGIIAEALPSSTLSDNLTFNDTFELVNLLDAGTATRAYILLLY